MRNDSFKIDILRLENATITWLSCVKFEYQSLDRLQKQRKWKELQTSVKMQHPELATSVLDNESVKESKFTQLFRLSEAHFIEKKKNPPDLIGLGMYHLMRDWRSELVEELRTFGNKEQLFDDVFTTTIQLFFRFVPEMESDFRASESISEEMGLKSFTPEDAQLREILNKIADAYEFSDTDPNVTVQMKYSQLDQYGKSRLLKIVDFITRAHAEYFSPTLPRNSSEWQQFSLSVYKQQEKMFNQSWASIREFYETADPIKFGPRNKEEEEQIDQAEKELKKQKPEMSQMKREELFESVLIDRPNPILYLLAHPSFGDPSCKQVL